MKEEKEKRKEWCKEGNRGERMQGRKKGRKEGKGEKIGKKGRNRERKKEWRIGGNYTALFARLHKEQMPSHLFSSQFWTAEGILLSCLPFHFLFLFLKLIIYAQYLHGFTRASEQHEYDLSGLKYCSWNSVPYNITYTNPLKGPTVHSAGYNRPLVFICTWKYWLSELTGRTGPLQDWRDFAGQDN